MACKNDIKELLAFLEAQRDDGQAGEQISTMGE